MTEYAYAYPVDTFAREMALKALAVAKEQEQEKEELVRKGVLRRRIEWTDRKTQLIHYDKVKKH